MGTTNSGKSTLINSMLSTKEREKVGVKLKKRSFKKRSFEGVELTESALPGTT